MTDLVRAGLHGLDRLLGPLLMARHLSGGGGTVFLYHRISPVADAAYPPLAPHVFEEHLGFIQRYFRVLPLAELLARRRAGKSLAGCAAITFDDGYADFLEFAYPLLERHALPVTHFVVADCVLTGRATWNLRLRRVFQRREQLGREARPLPTGDVEATKKAVGRMPAAERYRWLEEQETLLGPLPPEPPMLRPADLRRCDPELVEWGSHTRSHAMLGLLDAREIEAELRDSRRLLEDVIGARVRYISYPNNSYSPAAVRAAQACGYDAALAVDCRQVGDLSSAYTLPRFNVDYLPRELIRLELGGALGTLRRLRPTFQGG